ncbi:unnamed protein product, partial [Polarella glacialis]
NTPRCRITARGADGLGHQMEAKLTCMAVAAALGFEYIHVPLHHLDHKANATEIEEFLNLGAPYEHYSNWRGDDPILKKRDAPNVGRCKEPGWIRRVELGTETCKADGKTLYWHDNCWDRFYCYGFAESGFLYNLVPQFQRLYFAKPKPEPNWLEGMPGNWGAKVVMHIRGGDGAQISTDFYIRAREDLRKLLGGAGKSPPLFRVQTDANATMLLERVPALLGPDTIFDDKYSSTVTLAFHRMVVADAFVMARSGLSMTAAFIGNQSTVFMPHSCWDRQALPHWTKRSC